MPDSVPSTAGDVMHREPVSVSPDVRLYQVIDLMKQHHIRHLPCVEEERLVGIISDRDVKLHMSASFATSKEDVRDRVTMLKPAREVMTSNPWSARPETPLKELVGIMADRKFGAVPVVDGDGRLVGIVSQIDLLRVLVRLLA